MSRRTSRQRGVSLIEALVAFAILAFGMLGVVGMQGSMRTNADLARQRAEAVRLAQDAVEEWRGISTRPTTANRMAYQDIAGSATTRNVVGTNATYAIARRALAEPVVAQTVTPDRQGILVEVTWQDRSGQTQLVRLSSTLSAIEPELAASLVLATNADPVLPPMGRNRAIPRGAVPLGMGRSGLVPPGPAGAGVAWVFDNATAALTICTTAAASSGQLVSLGYDCSASVRGMLISGFVRHTADAPPTSASIVDPVAVVPTFELVVRRTAPTPVVTVGCFKDATINYAVQYYCGVPLDTSATWAGTLEFSTTSPVGPIAVSPTDSSPGSYKVCRYQDRPPAYVGIATALANQNFVFIKAGNGSVPFACPAGTWPHQPST